nr:zinc finger, CCHC-type [Tanacetum cinerariifolium]
MNYFLFDIPLRDDSLLSLHIRCPTDESICYRYTLDVHRLNYNDDSHNKGPSIPPSYSSGPSTPPSYSSGPSTSPNYSSGSSRNAECSNCKHLREKISVPKRTMNMHMHLEQHTVNSAALLHEVLNEIEKLDLEYMSVVYVLTTPMSEDGGENPTVEKVKKRAKWDNDDYVCRGLILNGMSDSLFDIYLNVKTSKEPWDTWEAKYIAEDASSERKTRKGQNRIKTRQKWEAWRSPAVSKAVAVNKERKKNEENTS